MPNKSKGPLTVYAMGFDARSANLLSLFFKANCKDLAILADEDQAEAAIIDIDSYNSQTILAEQRARHPGRALIVLSVREPENSFPGSIFVKKPVRSAEFLNALQKIIAARAEEVPPRALVDNPGQEAARVEATLRAAAPRAAPAGRFGFDEGRGKTRQAAAGLTDENQVEPLVYQARTDPSNGLADKCDRYDPGKYLQGYLENACKMALSRSVALCLNTGWKPIVILPHAREIMIEASDEQVRSFCLVPAHSVDSLEFSEPGSEIMSIVPANGQKVNAVDAMQYRVQRMEEFLWKVALWTSCGRIPQDVDLTAPVFLQCWPNFTRLQLSPNFLRIAALLVQQPRTLMDVAKALEIPQKDVFAFFSATRAIGLSGQVKRQDNANPAPSMPAPRKNGGFLKKILQRLITGRREGNHGEL